MTVSRSCSRRHGAAASAATGSTARSEARSSRSYRICPAIPTTSTAHRTEPTGWRWSACARRHSIWRCGCRASGSAWRGGRHPTSGSIRTSTRVASSASMRAGEILETLWDLGGAEPPDDHVDARAQGPSLYRRDLQQPHRKAASSTAPIPNWTGADLLLGPSDDRRADARTVDSCSGRGEAAVTVPPLDGALRPNRKLDEASRATSAGGRRLSRGGRRSGSWRLPGTAVYALARRAGLAPRRVSYAGGSRWPVPPSATMVARLRSPPATSSSMAAASTGADTERAADVRCITAMAASRERRSIVANGSADNAGSGLAARPAAAERLRQYLADRPRERQRAASSQDGLAWPAGLAVDGDSARLFRSVEASPCSDQPGRFRAQRQVALRRPAGLSRPASARPNGAIGWRCSRRAASSSNSSCASRPTAAE